MFTVISCILDGERAKRGSEVENELHGILVAVDGKPVQGARVKASPTVARLPKRGADTAGADSAVTDAKGRYAFRNLPPGRYNLLGDYASGNLVVLIPNVDRLDTSVEKDLGTDTLRAPGAIRGRLMLGSQGKRGVLAYIPGTSYLAASDSAGRFVIGGVPQGTHMVEYSATGFVIEPDTGVAVLSAKITDLPVKQLAYDPELPPPAPQTLHAVYDTLHERVLLAWDSVSVSDLEDYVVYRDQPPLLDPVVVENGAVTGTSFVDSTFEPPAGMEKKTLVYRVKSRDRGLNYSLNYSPSARLEAVSRQWVTTRIARSPSPADTVVTVNDTLTLKIAFENPTRKIREIGWYDLAGGETLRQREDSALAGADSLIWEAGGGPGSHAIEVRIVDDGGAIARTQFEITVETDPPEAMAGPDTFATPGDTVQLRGKGVDGRGRITAWAWACGQSGEFHRTSGGDTAVVLPPGKTDNMPCILRVTDDDGNSAYDTMTVAVLLDAPRAMAGPDTVVTPGDTVRLHGRGADDLGRIATWTWVCGGTGDFRATSSGDTIVVLPVGKTDAVTCILRVTDDDGNPAFDSMKVTVILDAPRAMAGPDTIATPGDTVRLRGWGEDGRGRIVDWAWACGQPLEFHRTSGGDTSVVLPPGNAGDVPCVLRVTDDDGNSAFDTLIVDVLLDAPRAMAGLDTLVSVGDTVRLRGAGADAYGSIAAWEWDIGGGGGFSSSPDGRFAFVAPSEAGDVACILRVTDDDGNRTSDTLRVRVVEDLPVAAAGPDRVATIKDVILLSGAGTDGFGSIVKYEWDVGGTGRFEASVDGTAEATLTEYPQAAYPAILRVTDDDGKQDVDTVLIAVLLDQPVASGEAAPGNHFQGDTVRLSARSSRDGMGTLVKLEWQIGESGMFSASGMDTSIVLPIGVNPLRCVLRVTDDDGLSSLDTVVIATLAREAQSWVKSAQSVGGIYHLNTSNSDAVSFQGRIWVFSNEFGTVTTHHSADGASWVRGVAAPLGFGGTVVAFKERLWLFGGGSGGSSDTGTGRVWSSGDGLTWTIQLDSLPFGRRSNLTVAEYKGRLWTLSFRKNDAETGTAADIWSSENGVAWEKSAQTIQFKNYVGYTSLLSHDGELFLFDHDGGDIWKTEDGESWIQLRNVGWTLFDRTSVSYAGRLWMIGGGWEDPELNPIAYSSEDGIAWFAVPGNPPLTARSNPLALSHDGKLWALGGAVPVWVTHLPPIHPQDVWHTQ